MDSLPHGQPRASSPVGPAQPIEQLEPASANIRRPIGQIFVELGLISDDQLRSALDVQKKTGDRIGEILVEQGSLSRLDLAGALAAHWEPGIRVAAAPNSSGTHGPTPAASDESAATAELRAAVTALEQRLQSIEERPAVAPVPPGHSAGARQREEEVAALVPRVAELARRLDELVPVADQLADLGTSVEGLAALRANEALATGARLARVEAAMAETASAESRLSGDLRDAEQRIADLVGQTTDLRASVTLLSEQSVAAGRANDAARETISSSPDEIGGRLDAPNGSSRKHKKHKKHARKGKREKG